MDTRTYDNSRRRIEGCEWHTELSRGRQRSEIGLLAGWLRRRVQSETCWIGVSHCAQLLEGVTFASCCHQALIGIRDMSNQVKAYCRAQSGFALNIRACETASVW